MKHLASILLLLLSVPATACDLQVIHSVPVYGSDVECTARTKFEGAKPEDTVVIPDGETVTLDRPSEVLDVIVRGTLIRSAPLKCRTLTVIGEHAEHRMTDGADIIWRDLPFADYDGGQWGRGLLAIGGGANIAETDNWRRARALLAREVKAGDHLFPLFGGKPYGWQAGDTLVLPDTRQPSSESELSAHTELVTIHSISDDGIVYLAEPVQFDHLGWHESSGNVGLLFDVANLTQPITFRSENPEVRGHAVAIAGGANFLCGVQFRDMGRTTTDPLGPDNIVGRYANHFHHNHGRANETREWQGEMIHCSVWGSPKWGVSIHNSYFSNVEDCAFFDCAGASIVTEQVQSYGFRITDNVAIAKSPGSGGRITNNFPGGRSNRNDDSATADHWHGGVFLGLGSAMGTITGNHGYCHKEGIGMAGFGATTLQRPLVRGVGYSGKKNDPNFERLTSYAGYGDEPRRYPFLFDTSGNQVWAGWRGIELWTADTHLEYEHGFDGLTLVHCNTPTDLEDQQETVMRGWRHLGDFAQVVLPEGGKSQPALNFKPGYRFGVTAIDCEYRGYGCAYELVDDDEYTRFERCVFECPVINYMPAGRAVSLGDGWKGEWLDCEFIGDPLFADGWFPKFDLSARLSPNRTDRKALLPVRYFVRPWHDGRDYQVFHYEQHPDWEHRRGDPGPDVAYGDFPAGVWTQQQLVDRGTSVFGDVVPDGAVQWGRFYAAEISQDCCEQLQRALQRIKELEQQ